MTAECTLTDKPMMATHPRAHDAYTVGWVCALPKEQTAAIAMLDERHPNLSKPPNDPNSYTLGSICDHNIVIACLPKGKIGTTSAATVATYMIGAFPAVRFELMVGIGGGVPPKVRLGDVVVSVPAGQFPGVVQWDMGKAEQGGTFRRTGALNNPPSLLLSALATLESDHELEGSKISQYLEELQIRYPRLAEKYLRSDSLQDILFKASYGHVEKQDQDASEEGEDEPEDCRHCDQTQTAKRKPRDMRVHYGLIASGNQVVKDAAVRDQLSKDMDKKVLCVEMEAAGLMDNFPCIVIRGICDYADSHKNKAWQEHAAAVAAAFAKELLGYIRPHEVDREKTVKDALAQVNENLEKISSNVNNVQSRVESMQTGKHSDDITRWLGASDVSKNLNKALQTRHPGSGQRLIQGEAYQRWKTQARSFLWLYGIPGCGKTILTSTAIEDLRASPDHSATLLYFYFDFTDTQKQQFENTIRSLVWQLYHKNESARKDLSALYSSCNNGRDQPRIDRLQEIFAKMVQVSGDVWVVLDALDECTVRDELLSWLKDLRTGEQNVHLLVTSRPERDIRSAIQQFSHEDERIPIQDDLIEADIRSYVYSQIRKDEAFEIWNERPDIQDEMETSLVSKANGMFRWVWCQLTALRQCRDPIALRKALTSLPRTLDETYARILRNVPPEYVDHTIRILQFLTYSERPLRLAEAVDAIAVKVGADTDSGRRFDPRNRMPVPGDIIGYCSSLVVLVRRTDLGNDKSIIEEIQLAHFSVKDYLTSDRLASDTMRYLQATAARSLIAEVCLTYLLELKEPENIASIRDDFPLSQFSAQYWASHAVIGERSSESVLKLAQKLLRSRNLLRIWCSLYDPDRPWDEEPNITNIAPALYYASLQGLLQCVQRLLDEGADVNAQGGYYGDALCAASSRGHQAIMQLLLENGADVNAQGGEYGNALCAASEEGHLETVQLLLDKNADVNRQGGDYGNALYAASEEGHLEIVQILIDNGADVNRQGGRYGNALHAASEEGHREIVQLLLKNGADVNAPGGSYGSALQAASSRGHQAIVQLLLENGADVNAQGGGCGNALYAASSRGHQAIVQLLLDNGADVNAQGGRYGSALQAASYREHQAIVQLLLDNKADINAQGGHYGNALQAAVSKGNQGIVQILLDNKADINAQGGHYGNALQTALEKGYLEIVQLLLDNGADVNRQGGRYGNALHAALEEGHLEIVQLLLDNGADVNGQGEHHGNALQAASAKGYFEIVQLLLEVNTIDKILNRFFCAAYMGKENYVQVHLALGIQVNTQAGRFGTALQTGSIGGHEKIVEILLNAGADVNAQGGEYGNALQAASAIGHAKIVKMLLEKGANVHAQGGLYGNALQAALVGGYQQIVQILLNAGANTNRSKRRRLV